MFKVSKLGVASPHELDVHDEAERIAKADDDALAVVVLVIREDGTHVGLEHNGQVTISEMDCAMLDGIMAMRKAVESKNRIHLPGDDGVFGSPGL
jgi:hypothetical protein